MAPITFNGCVEVPPNPGNSLQQQLERKPPAVPRKSPRNSGCSDDEVNFLGKLTKFEMLARQARANCVSPKVFPSGSLTTNVPAEQILGHSRSSSLVSLGRSSTSSPFQNLLSLDRYHHGQDEQKLVSQLRGRPPLAFFNRFLISSSDYGRSEYKTVTSSKDY
jgi:hypothetical protein